MKIIEVVAAVILNKKKCILIARRKAEKMLGGKWEFPGGKVEKNEDHRLALERELLEELGIQTKTRDFIGSNSHSYGHTTINLNAYLSEYVDGVFQLSDHDKIEWVEIKDLTNYDLADADIPLIQKIRSQLKI